VLEKKGSPSVAPQRPASLTAQNGDHIWVKGGKWSGRKAAP